MMIAEVSRVIGLPKRHRATAAATFETGPPSTPRSERLYRVYALQASFDDVAYMGCDSRVTINGAETVSTRG